MAEIRIRSPRPSDKGHPKASREANVPTEKNQGDVESNGDVWDRHFFKNLAIRASNAKKANLKIAVPALLTLVIWVVSSTISFLHRTRHHAEVDLVLASQENYNNGGTELRWIPEVTRDPRELFALRYPDTNTSWTCPRLPNSIRSIDDVVANRTSCADARRIGLGIMFMNPQMPGVRFAFAEVLKSATSTVEYTIDKHHCPRIYHDVQIPRLGNCIVAVAKGIHSVVDTEQTIAFTFVRHPIHRFISGYRQVFLHWLVLYPKDKRKKIPQAMREILDAQEPERFHKVVDFFVSNGLGMIDPFLSDGDQIPNFLEDQLAMGFMHLISQMWFLSQYPGKIDYIGKIENLHEQITWVRTNLMGLKMAPNTEPLYNRHLRQDEDNFECPTLKYILANKDQYRSSLDKLNKYFARELDFFEYEPL
mmetsp:Transcript_18947/g.26391  ORF Transcript_18947/g.26391 Transcript_18947/m.26391 type:complete len:421 (+) Transcript_18947:58-1320(+)